MSERAERKHVIDVLRGMSALLVVLYHYLYHYFYIYKSGYGALSIFAIGKFGVHVFFIISGFVILHSISRVKNVCKFIKGRILRIYPTYAVSVIITFIVVSFLGLPGRQVSLTDLFINLTMLQHFFGIKNVDGVYWTLVYEIIFYIWACLLLVHNKRNMLFGIINPFIVVIHLLIYFVCPSFEYNVFSALILYKYYYLFAYGILLYFLFNKVDVKFIQLQIIFLCMYLFVFEQHPLIVLFFSVLVFFLIKLNPKIIGLKFFLYLSGLSYPLYLIHQNVGFALITKFIGYNLYFSVVFAFFVSLMLAVILNKYVEHKFRM